MLTKFVFSSIVAAVVIQRLFELRLAQRNKKEILKRGGRERDTNSLKLVKLLQVSWWIAAIAEVWLLDRPFIPVLAAVALAAMGIGQLLRYLSMRSLDWRWTLPIMTVPNLPVVDTGIYRYLRHPNWLGVLLEITALPLIHSAYLTAIVFTIVNAFLMSQRIQTEEKVLSEDTNYAFAFAERPRFIPNIIPKIWG